MRGKETSTFDVAVLVDYYCYYRHLVTNRCNEEVLTFRLEVPQILVGIKFMIVFSVIDCKCVRLCVVLRMASYADAYYEIYWKIIWLLLP